MTDHYLKAADEAELRSLLIAAGILLADDSPTAARRVEHFPVPGYALDIIGQIVKPHPADPEQTVTVPGYHANLRGDLTDAQRAILAPILIASPAQPYRVWG